MRSGTSSNSACASRGFPTTGRTLSPVIRVHSAARSNIRLPRACAADRLAAQGNQARRILETLETKLGIDSGGGHRPCVHDQ